MTPKKWTSKQERNLDYCRKMRRQHWAAMMAWSKEVRQWEKIKLDSEKGSGEG